MKKITDKQQKVLDQIKQFISENSYPPTIQEINELCGFKSANAAWDHVLRLEIKGYIARQPGKSRSIRILV